MIHLSMTNVPVAAQVLHTKILRVYIALCVFFFLHMTLTSYANMCSIISFSSQEICTGNAIDPFSYCAAATLRKGKIPYGYHGDADTFCQ